MGLGKALESLDKYYEVAPKYLLLDKKGDVFFMPSNYIEKDESKGMHPTYYYNH